MLIKQHKMKQLLVVLTILAIIIGCSGRDEGFLLGKWEDVQRVDSSSIRIIWDFKADNNTLLIQMYERDSIGEFVETDTMNGNYNFYKEWDGIANLKEYFIDISITGRSFDYYNIAGKYWVEEISRDFLYMTREEWPPEDTLNTDDNPFLRLEFRKQ